MDYGHQLALVLLSLYNFYLSVKKSSQVENFQSVSFIKHDLEKYQAVNMSIHVFAWRRTKSLQRLCNSLLRARYLNYRVSILFHVDGDPLPSVVSYLESFVWPFGEKTIIQSPYHLGMPNVWLPEAHSY